LLLQHLDARALDRGVEAVIDVLREQVLEVAPVAFGIGGHDHLVGLARTVNEGFRLKAWIDLRDLEQPVAHVLVDAGIILDALLGIGLRHVGGGECRSLAVPPRHGDDIIGRGRRGALLAALGEGEEAPRAAEVTAS